MDSAPSLFSRVSARVRPMTPTLWRTFCCAFIAMTALLAPAVVRAENVLVVAADGTHEEAAAGLTPLLTGHDITQETALPADVSGYQQIWDLRANVALSGDDQATYLAFLQGGGRAFIMGENTSYGEARDPTIVTLLDTLGAGAFVIEDADDSQTINAPWNGEASAIMYPSAGAFTSRGNGTFITHQTALPTRGSALAFSPGTMTNAAAGTLAIVLDVNFLMASYVDAEENPGCDDLARALVGYVGGTITEALAVAGVTAPASGSYKAGANLDFTVAMSGVATITGTPRLALSIGGQTRYAAYVSGDGSSSLLFRYTVVAEDADADGIAVTSPIDLNDGSIKSGDDTDAVVTFTAPNTAAVLIDNIAPTVESVARNNPADAATAANAVVFRVTFSEPVSGVGAADFTLTRTGSMSASIADVSAVSAAVFDVTVDGISGIGTLRLDVAAGGVTDAAGSILADGFATGASYTIDTSATFPIAADFNDADNASLAAAGWLLAGDAAAVDNRLRLTRALNILAGTAIYNQAFSSAVGVNVQFDYEMSGGTGADGLAFFLVDGAQASPTSGGSGPSFGYVYGGPGVPGASLGYLGVGFDLWGNYTATQSFHDGAQETEAPNRIALRGPGTITGSESADDEYDYVVGSSVGYAVGGVRKVNLTITPDGLVSLLISADGGDTWTTIYDGFDFGASSAFDGYTQPATLKLGFGASTGGSNNLHAIDDVIVRKPADHTIAFTDKPSDPQNAGATVSYTLTVTNAGWNDDPAARLFYTVPAGLTDVAWSYAVDGGAPVTGTTAAIDETLALPAGKSAVLVVQATIEAGAAGTTLAHTATVTPSAAFGDLAPVDNTATTSTAVTPRPVVTSELTANGSYRGAFTYTITATNSPASFGATGLPTGLNLNAATGVISGAPTQTGEFNVALTGTNGSGTGTASTLVITIAKAALTVTANDHSREFGETNPTLTLSYTGLLGGDTAAVFATPPTATTTATSNSAPGTFAITPGGGVSDRYTFTYVPGVLTVVPAWQTITFPAIAGLVIGDVVTLGATASSGRGVSYSVVSGPATVSGTTLTATGVGMVTVRASEDGGTNYQAAANVDRSFSVGVAPANVSTPTQVPVPPVGGTAELEVTNSNPNMIYQWQRNGSDLPGSSGSSLTLNDVQPPTAGLYTYTATLPGGGGGTSEPVIVGLTTDELVIGTGEQVGADIVHPNGNVYDQVLLEGNGASITSKQNKVTRVSFVDLTNDIVQVEFSGAGTLSVVMDDASQPAPPINYNQENVDYVRGHVGLVITGANETSNLSVISVGPITAVNQSLFKEGVTYDGVADLAFVAIQSANGKFGGIRTGNVSYYASQGFTGVYAPGVEFAGPINIGEVTAFDSATPVLVFGAAGTVNITGGNLAQDNSSPVAVSGITQVRMVDGTTSQGASLPAQPNQGVLTEVGVDVTSQIVVNP